MNLIMNIDRIQVVSIVFSIIFLLFIIELTRKERIREAYSLLWLFMGIVFLALSIWREGLDVLSEFAGVAYPPAALFLVMLMILTLILIQFSIVVSGLTDKIKTLTQELAILKAKFERKDSNSNQDKS